MEGKIVSALVRLLGKVTPPILHAARLTLGGLFLYTGLRKAFATEAFARDIQNYGLLGSADAILMLAVYLPWLEIAAGAALIVRRLQLGALIIVAALMLVFTGALCSAWFRGLDISCGCFVEERPLTTRTHFAELLARDLALLLTATLLLRIEWRRASVDKPAAPAQVS